MQGPPSLCRLLQAALHDTACIIVVFHAACRPGVIDRSSPLQIHIDLRLDEPTMVMLLL